MGSYNTKSINDHIRNYCNKTKSNFIFLIQETFCRVITSSYSEQILSGYFEPSQWVPNLIPGIDAKRIFLIFNLDLKRLPLIFYPKSRKHKISHFENYT